jgi:hypothetical protein
VSAKLKGVCQNCSKGAVLEAVEVRPIGASTGDTSLQLCGRCATYPNAVWRRRFEPVGMAQAHK